jgi:hypothetical protein
MREDLGGFLAAQAAGRGRLAPARLRGRDRRRAALAERIGNRQLILSGRVDRVDAGPAGLRIVDYKTGKLGKDGYPEPPSLAGGKNLQLAYYARALAAERTRSGEPAADVHAAYLGVSTASGFRAIAWEPRHFERAEAEFQRVVEGRHRLASSAASSSRSRTRRSAPSSATSARSAARAARGSSSASRATRGRCTPPSGARARPSRMPRRPNERAGTRAGRRADRSRGAQ